MHFSNILHFFSPAAGKIEMTLCPLLVGVNRKQALTTTITFTTTTASAATLLESIHI